MKPNIAKCGACTVCCTVLAIDEMEKAAGRECDFCTKRGCGIYETRPNSCRAFECIWLESQKGNNPMPKALRPDRSGALMVSSDSEFAMGVHMLKEINPLQDDLLAPFIESWSESGINLYFMMPSGKKYVLRRKEKLDS